MSLFQDLLVIDCASFIAGPAAATIMSDFGARVIKIEPPDEGDSYRQLMKVPGMPPAERDYFWTLDNRNKKSLALDLKHEAARPILETLIRKADVFITNFPGPIRERLRLTPGDVLIAGADEAHRTEVILKNVYIHGITPDKVHLKFANIVTAGTNIPLGPGGGNKEVKVVAIDAAGVKAYSCDAKFVPFR